MADEEQDQSSKTEDPTQHKLDESRRRGQVPLSREVSTWILLLASTFVVTSMGDDMARALTIHMRHYLEFAHSMPTGPGGLRLSWWIALW
jgi:flagellar biosynthetic protein FlhB